MNIIEATEGFIDNLINSGELDPYDYTGVHSSEYPKPCDIVVGGMLIAEVEFVMHEKEDGDYDGCIGFNVRSKL